MVSPKIGRFSCAILLLFFAFCFAPSCSQPAGDTPVSDAGTGGSSDGPRVDASGPEFRVQFIDPVSGPFLGGTAITIRGNGFTESSQVFVGGRLVEPLNQEFVDSRRILIATPPGEPGSATVEVRNPGESTSLADAYTYEAIYADPPSGSVTGGTRVTLVGFGTDFSSETSIRFDGLPLVDVQVVSALVLTGTTPPGTSGQADIDVTTTTSVYSANDGYSYLATADPFAGGTGGGPIDGDVNIVVLDSRTHNGVDNAFASIGNPQSSPFQGYADDLGQISFSSEELRGRIDTYVAAPGYESASFVQYDARDLTVLLRQHPLPPPPDLPEPPPPGVGPQSGRIYGSIVFGDATGLGSPVWNLVPEPRGPDEIKRIYVSTTASSIFNRRSAQAIIDYQGFDASQTAWEFHLNARPSATAVVAMAGLYNTLSEQFQPFAMGLTRGVLVGPGEEVVGIDVVVDIPLDASLLVNLDKAPNLNTPGWIGPVEYTIRPVIDLGGEGAIVMNGHGQPALALPALQPGTYRFDEASSSIVLQGMAPLTGNLADASYSFIAGAYSADGAAPFSIRIERGITNISTPITIGDFLGTPRPVDPAPDTIASANAFHLQHEAPSTGSPTFTLHQFVDADGEKLLRTFTRGAAAAEVPDFRGKMVPLFPSLAKVFWTFFSFRIVGQSFDEFSYRHLRRDYWSAYAADSHTVQFPQRLP